MTRAAVALACLALAACAPPPSYRPSYSSYSPPPSAPEPQTEPGRPITLTAQQQQVVRAGVTRGLKDPESARFGGMSGVKDKDGDITVCGMVNAKNSYGGYAGMSPYIGMFLRPTEFRVVDIAVSDKDRLAVLKVCQSRGIERI